MKKIIFVLVMVCNSLFSMAELKHYLTYNTNLYTNFYNAQKDAIGFKHLFRLPSASYKIEKNNLGLSFSLNYKNQLYQNYKNGGIITQGIKYISSTNYCVNVTYLILKNKYFKITPNFGLVHNHYFAFVMDEPYDGFFQCEVPAHFEEEKIFGLSSGLNFNMPIFKQIFFNTNLTYTTFPTALYNKRNFIFEVGLGYRYQRKKQKQ